MRYLEKISFILGLVLITVLLVYFSVGDLSYPTKKIVLGEATEFFDGWTGQRNTPRYFKVTLDSGKEVRISHFENIKEAYRGRVKVMELESNGNYNYRILGAVK